MGKLTTFVKYIDDDGTITEWQGTIDTDSTGGGNVKGLIDRFRLLVRRELISRGLIVPTEDDTKRKR